jgi:hypothetical protein
VSNFHHKETSFDIILIVILLGNETKKGGGRKMKRIVTILAVLAMVLLLTNMTVFAKDFFFDTVMNKTISTSTAAKQVDLGGFKDFSVIARFEGPPNSEVYFEIGFNQLTVIQERVKINEQGWLNFAKIYPVYGPTVGLAIYNPPANLKARIMIYAGH